MDFMSVLISAAIVGITGMIIGILLGVAGEKFKVEVDEREFKIRELLPGNNCGGCGFAGCDALAKAIAEGKAPVNACPVAGSESAKKIGSVMGVDSEETERMTAFVKCGGTCDKTEIKYNYYGISDCRKLALIPGNGDKMCSYGCMGHGSCVNECPFDAIHIEEGVAVVEKEKCKACGKCISVCPKNLIELVPYAAEHIVRCSSREKGKDVKKACQTGCIGCMICVKVCEADAVKVENNIAYIDQSKCTRCGKCAEKCPSKIII